MVDAAALRQRLLLETLSESDAYPNGNSRRGGVLRISVAPYLSVTTPFWFGDGSAFALIGPFVGDPFLRLPGRIAGFVLVGLTRFRFVLSAVQIKHRLSGQWRIGVDRGDIDHERECRGKADLIPSGKQRPAGRIADFAVGSNAQDASWPRKPLTGAPDIAGGDPAFQQQEPDRSVSRNLNIEDCSAHRNGGAGCPNSVKLLGGQAGDKAESAL